VTTDEPHDCETVVNQRLTELIRELGDVIDLEVDGVVPVEINGTFFRVQPDHRYPPLFEDDINFNGDGAVTAIRIQNGHVDFKQRYVRTDRYQWESEARKALFGRCKPSQRLPSASLQADQRSRSELVYRRRAS
jgi:carotenoid cleavage dioxygenase-like enzyme